MRYMVMHYQTQEMEDGVLPSPERQAAIEKAVLGIDTLDDAALLAALLTPAVRAPLD